MNPFDREAAYYDFFHKDKDYQAEARRIRALFPEAVTVLEVGAGTGNLTCELEKLGFQVTALEPSPGMLAFYKGKGEVIAGRLQDFPLPSMRYDLVLALYDVLNYIPPQERPCLLSYGEHFYAETWDMSKGVRFFTHKALDGCHRIRIGLKLRAIHLWYIFWGRGLVVTRHRLYP